MEIKNKCIICNDLLETTHVEIYLFDECGVLWKGKNWDNGGREIVPFFRFPVYLIIDQNLRLSWWTKDEGLTASQTLLQIQNTHSIISFKSFVRLEKLDKLQSL